MKYSIEILKDQLDDIYDLQTSPKFAIDEQTFKERRISIETAIKILEQ